MREICIIGSGFSGAIIARKLAEKNFKVVVFDSRNHIGGNCFTYKDKVTGIMVHKYGPHIFHTNNREVWDFVNTYDEFIPYINRVKALSKDKVYNLPINLLTINSFFGKSLNPKEAREFLHSIGDNTINNPASFEDQALKFVGKDLYEAFFKGYTIKQWGIDPKLLPASILKRLPIRFNYDDNYYSSTFQGIPRHGYTYIIEKLLDHNLIEINLSTKLSRSDSKGFLHIFNSGPIDDWFEYQEGKLAYRTLDFKSEIHEDDFQGNAVMNYCDQDIKWTRITEHKHFTPHENFSKTLIFKEFSRLHEKGDIPYYPVRLTNDKKILYEYIKKVENEQNITFIGRLGTYRYLDMHITIEEALKTADNFLDAFNKRNKIPKFSVYPS